MEDKRQAEDLGNTIVKDMPRRDFTEEGLAESSRIKVPAANVSEACAGRSTKVELD